MLSLWDTERDKRMPFTLFFFEECTESHQAVCNKQAGEPHHAPFLLAVGNAGSPLMLIKVEHRHGLSKEEVAVPAAYRVPSVTQIRKHLAQETTANLRCTS